MTFSTHIFTAFSALFLLASSCAFAGWESLPPLPEPNGGFACGFVGGRLLVAGGTQWVDGQKHWLGTIRCYDPATAQWSTLGRLPHAWAYGACGVIHDHLILAGGSDGRSGLREILAIDATGAQQSLGELPQALIYTAGTVFHGQLLMAAGATDPVDLGTFTSDAFLISFTSAPLRATVKALPKLAGTGFGIGTAAAAQGQAFIFGGARPGPDNSVRNLDTLHGLSPQGQPLASSAHLPKPVRGLAALALTDRLIYLAGGYLNDDTGFTDEAWLFDTVAHTFTSAQLLPIKGAIHLAEHGGWVYALGGEDQKKHRSARMWRISVAELAAP